MISKCLSNVVQVYVYWNNTSSKVFWDKTGQRHVFTSSILLNNFSVRTSCMVGRSLHGVFVISVKLFQLPQNCTLQTVKELSSTPWRVIMILSQDFKQFIKNWSQVPLCPDLLCGIYIINCWITFFNIRRWWLGHFGPPCNFIDYLKTAKSRSVKKSQFQKPENAYSKK